MIKITNLNKYYNKGKTNEIHVINNTSLQLPEKGLISFLGTSGSGKTTLLNVIGGLDKATGTLVYDDLTLKNYNVGKIDKYRQENIGYVFQNYNLLPNETVYDNLVIALELMGIIDKKEVEKRIEYTLKAVGMYKFRKKQAYALSGGQQQRVSIARALLKNAKIIIADEPTGNLDTENTIEVMKILKKISKNTLVLLVTHNISIAKYYSDRIIELKDGNVIADYVNDTKSASLESNSNNVYLKDLNCQSATLPAGNVNLYHVEGEECDIDVKIVVRNGNYYIETNKPIKLIENSNLHLIDDHYKPVVHDEEEEANYDTSWFSKPKKGIKEFFTVFLKMFKESYLSLKKLGKKGKLINLSFVLMGMLLSLGVVCLINFTYVDTSEFIYADNHYQLTTDDHTFYQDPLINIVENYKEGNISNVSLYQPKSILFFGHRLTFQKGINVEYEIMVGSLEALGGKKVLFGRIPNNSKEVVVDAFTAEKLAANFGNRATMDQMVGKNVTLTMNGGSVQVSIVGIIEGSQNAVFGNEEFYVNWCCPATDNKYNINKFRYYEYETDVNGEPLYEIIEGTGFTGGPELEVLLPEGSEYYGFDVVSLLEKTQFKVVGVYRYKDGTINAGNDEYIINNKSYTQIQPSKLYQGICANKGDYYLIDGRDPETLDECIVSTYLIQYQIGDTVKVKDGNKYKEYKVVGKYIGSMKGLSTLFIQTKESYIFEHYKAEEICFSLNGDPILTGNEVVRSLEQLNLLNKEENKETNMVLYELLFIVLVFICSVFVYLVTRSRTISLIYEVGVKRSIGASKGKILAGFFIDDFVITTLFSLVGYVVIFILYNFVAELVNYYLKTTFLIVENSYFILGVIIMYLVNMIIGILPISSLLRKTPAEICAKYDI